MRINLKNISNFDKFIKSREIIQENENRMKTNAFLFRYFFEFSYSGQKFAMEINKFNFEKVYLSEFIFILNDINSEEKFEIKVINIKIKNVFS